MIYLIIYCTYTMMNLIINRLVYTATSGIYECCLLQTILSRETSRATHLNSKQLQGQQQQVIKRFLFCSQVAPEVIWEDQKSKNFLGDHAPRPPYNGRASRVSLLPVDHTGTSHFKILDPPLLYIILVKPYDTIMNLQSWTSTILSW